MMMRNCVKFSQCNYKSINAVVSIKTTENSQNFEINSLNLKPTNSMNICISNWETCAKP